MLSSGARPRPSASPNATASPTAAIDAPSTRLATSFIAAPAPGPPTCVSEPSDSRIGRTRSKRSEEHTSELQSRLHLVCRLLLEKKKHNISISATEQTGSSFENRYFRITM